jgi:hypothetical protein
MVSFVLACVLAKTQGEAKSVLKVGLNFFGETMELNIDPEFAALIPPLSPDELAGLTESLVKEGCRDALIAWEFTAEMMYAAGYGVCKDDNCSYGQDRKQVPAGAWALGDGIWQCPECGYGIAPMGDHAVLLDGHNRYMICTERHIPYEVEMAEDIDDRLGAMIWIRTNQAARRNLTDDQRAMNGAGLLDLLSEQAKRERAAKGTPAREAKKANSTLSANVSDKVKPKTDNRAKVAKSSKVSERKVRTAAAIRKAAPELAKEVESGNMTLKAAQKQVRKDKNIDTEKARAAAAPKAEWIVTDKQDVVQCASLITDPPYGILDEPWEPDDLERFTRKWASRWSKCGADTMLIFWSQRHLWRGREWLDEELDGYEFQQLLVWHYANNKSPQSRKGFKQTWEPIFFYRRKDSDRKVVVSGGAWGDDLNDFDCHVAAVPQSNFNGAEQKQHPAQKPVSVFRWLINAVTKPGELVCDAFVGSGTSGIAAVQLGRGFHGIENDPASLELARRRVAAYG